MHDWGWYVQFIIICNNKEESVIWILKILQQWDYKNVLSDSKNTIVIFRSIHKTAFTAPWKSLSNKFEGRSSPRSEYAFVLFRWCITKIEYLDYIPEENSKQMQNYQKSVC